MEEPLEGEETGHRDGEDELAEWVHGRPTPLRKDGEKKEGKGLGRRHAVVFRDEIPENKTIIRQE